MKRYNSPVVEIKDFEKDVVIMSNGGFIADGWAENEGDFIFTID